MDISFFLAKVLGWYLVIMNLNIFIMPDNIRRVVDDIIRSRGMFFLSAVLALIIGILLVVAHNEWLFNWRVLITLTGWMALLKGIVNISFPQFTTQLTARYLNSDFAYRIVAVFGFSIGIILLYCGFFLS